MAERKTKRLCYWLLGGKRGEGARDPPALVLCARESNAVLNSAQAGEARGAVLARGGGRGRVRARRLRRRRRRQRREDRRARAALGGGSEENRASSFPSALPPASPRGLPAVSSPPPPPPPSFSGDRLFSPCREKGRERLAGGRWFKAGRSACGEERGGERRLRRSL